MPLRARGTIGALGVKTGRAGVAGCLVLSCQLDLRPSVCNEDVDP